MSTKFISSSWIFIAKSFKTHNRGHFKLRLLCCALPVQDREGYFWFMITKITIGAILIKNWMVQRYWYHRDKLSIYLYFGKNPCSILFQYTISWLLIWEQGFKHSYVLVQYLPVYNRCNLKNNRFRHCGSARVCRFFVFSQ